MSTPDAAQIQTRPRKVDIPMDEPLLATSSYEATEMTLYDLDPRNRHRIKVRARVDGVTEWIFEGPKGGIKAALWLSTEGGVELAEFLSRTRPEESV